MVRNYIRSSDRQSFTLEQLQSAISAVRNGASKRWASREYGVPKKTLLRYLTNDGHPTSVSRFGSFSSVFTAEQEEELVEYLLFMSECFFGLTQTDVRSFAFELADMNGIPHPFEASERLAGYDWLKCFLKRHTNLALRTPENTSMARATGFNRNSVNKFFDLLEGILNDHQYPSHRVWNMDETGFSTVSTKAPKVIARKGQHQVGGISSSERGINTTVVVGMSASGEFLPLMFIFARVRMNDALKIGAPEGSVFACNPNGWSTIPSCSQWFDHFLAYTRPTADSPVLLILDGHTTHTRNLPMIVKAKQNNVRILSIPPHTSHKVQPLDVTMVGPLKAHYNTAMGNLLKKNPGKVITPYDVSALVNEAFDKSASVQVAKNGFRATGIHPFDRSVFSATDFAAADFLLSAKNAGSQLPEEPVNERVASNDDQARNEINIVNSDSALISMPVDQIDENEYYVIRSNGDIIIGPILNLEYSFADQQTEQDSVNGPEELLDASAYATYQERSLPIDGQNDDEVFVEGQMHGESEESVENPENAPLILQDVKKKRVRKGRVKEEMKGKTDESAADASPQPIKKRRWDYNLDKRADVTKPKKFMVSPSSVAERLAVIMLKPEPKRRKKSGTKKEQAVELTSSPHRKKLVETSALKDISNIRKTVRKRSNRKSKVLITDDCDDVLCFTCGGMFSVSVNGNGWSKCVLCQQWFHATCAGDMDKCDACR